MQPQQRRGEEDRSYTGITISGSHGVRLRVRVAELTIKPKMRVPLLGVESTPSWRALLAAGWIVSRFCQTDEQGRLVFLCAIRGMFGMTITHSILYGIWLASTPLLSDVGGTGDYACVMYHEGCPWRPRSTTSRVDDKG